MCLADPDTDLIPIAENILSDKIKSTGYNTKDENFKELLHQDAPNQNLDHVAEIKPNDEVESIEHD